jgi:hypothetical protein
MNNLNMPLSNIESLMKTIINQIFRNLNVCLPATVVTYNSEKNTVKLQPAIQDVLPDKTFRTLPLLLNVPVLEIGGKNLSVKIPLQEGDTGIVIFCDRDITLFKQEKKNTQPNTLRKHDLADGIFIPMRFGNAGATDNISIESADGSTKFEVTSSGITIKGNVTIDGTVTSSGDITTAGKLTATDVTTSTVASVNNHIHSGGHNGGNTGKPVA